MTFSSTKRTSLDMVTMPLPTGLLIEYFHRLVCVLLNVLLTSETNEVDKLFT